MLGEAKENLGIQGKFNEIAMNHFEFKSEVNHK